MYIKDAQYLFIGCCLFLITSCVQTKDTIPSPPSTYYHDIIQRFHKLHKGLEVPDYLLNGETRQREREFDVMSYFNVLSHISMEPNYVLDYVYCAQGLGGQPLVYARLSGDAPFETPQELFDAYKKRQDTILSEEQFYVQLYQDFLTHIKTDQSKEGFFELLMLRMFAGQFYLYWHANYSDKRLLYDNESLEDLLSEVYAFGSLPEAFKEKARTISLKPRIVLNEERVKISVITFTRWGGLFRDTYEIRTNFPHELLKVSRKNLIKYDCGILF